MAVRVADDWSIQQLARLVGTTSRTLRHYDELGLLPPSRIGSNGYRYYDQAALLRLQRILLLRELGLGLPAIAEVLDRDSDPTRALRTHLGWLRAEQERLGRQVVAVQHTIDALERGGELMAQNMFDGFDHTQYQDEVEQRWGKQAYARSDAWWRGMSTEDRASWQAQSDALIRDWQAAATAGTAPDSEAAQQLAARHVAWLRGIPGTPTADPDGALAGYLTGLGDMYVADPRFAATYGGEQGATFVRDALRTYADRHL